MMQPREAHKILGIGYPSSLPEIKRAYRALAMTCHPDKGGNEDAFKKINTAYEVLTNGGSQKPLQRSAGGDRGTVTVTPVTKLRKTNVIISKIFNLTIREALVGVEKKISLQHREMCQCSERCNVCQGCGMVKIEQKRQMGQATFQSCSTGPCKICNGAGIMIKNRVCEKCGDTRYTTKNTVVTIPFKQGTREGHVRTLRDVIPSYDMSIEVVYLPDDVFTCTNEGDLCCVTTIDLYDSIFGKELEIHHPSNERIKINTFDMKKVVKSGDEMKIVGKGVTSDQDLRIKFKVKHPTHELDFSTHTHNDLNMCKMLMKELIKMS